MSFHSLDQILKQVQRQPGWDQYHRFQYLLQVWQKTVSPQILAHAKPLYIARKILWVATSSSSWSQNLSLQRFSLLKKLNAQLADIGEVLDDIRFSPVNWSKSEGNNGHNSPETDLNSEHPSYLDEDVLKSLEDSLPEGNTPETAFKRWVEDWKKRSQLLPLCPQCQAPTPPGELQRWGVCCHCARSGIVDSE